MSTTLPPPSIFNDVLGPVMRGPSSSHSAAALRIGRLARDLAGGSVRRAVVEYDPAGSLVTTHESQGSDLGLAGGLMGWETDDPRLPDFARELDAAGIRVDVRYVDYGATHPNTYRLTVWGDGGGESHLTAVSTGGGMIEVTEVEGVPVRIGGDYFETLVFVDAAGAAGEVESEFAAAGGTESVERHEGSGGFLVQVRSRGGLDADLLGSLRSTGGVTGVRVLRPVLPVLSRSGLEVPFLSCGEMEAYRAGLAGGGGSLGDLAAEYEAARGGIGVAEVRERMDSLVRVMEDCVRRGLEGTEFEDRILPCQSKQFAAKMEGGALVPGDVLNRAILYVSAIMEMKSSLGVIVAAPTAGSCGALPGAVLAVADVMGVTREQRIDAMLAAGMIGVFIAARSTFAAEVAGCMAECGSGASMAAAGIVGLAGGTFEQQLGAASMALQSSFGMTCDTVANRVEAPCLGRNVTAASNAIASANMALAGYQHLVPFDEVVDAMRQVGDLMPREVCCTGLAGLAVTPTSRKIADGLAACRCGASGGQAEKTCSPVSG